MQAFASPTDMASSGVWEITSANNISGYKYYGNNICQNQHKQVGLPSANNRNWLNKHLTFGKNIQIIL